MVAMSSNQHRDAIKAFTLIELLVVITIIALLIAQLEEGDPDDEIELLWALLIGNLIPGGAGSGPRGRGF